MTPTRSWWRVTMVPSSRGTLCWTLTGPGAGGGSTALTNYPADEHLDGELIGPYVRELPGAL